MNNIQRVSDAMLCSNCGACKAICPKDAITFKTTSVGRKYAYVEEEKCVDCSLCTKACPSLNQPFVGDEDPYVGHVLSVNVGRSIDDSIYKNAQSGGACTALLAYLFDSRRVDCALVCRMDYGNPPKVSGVLITDKQQLEDAQKSCYTPVDLLSQLKEAKKFKSVAVVGLPCHIQGVNNLIKNSKHFSNITYKLGLICDRTLCGGIQHVMLSFVRQGEYKIDWRRKDFKQGDNYYPYLTAPVVVYDKSLQGGVNIMPNQYRFALKDMFTSPRCRVCADKLNTSADIVLGDPWLMTDIDWNHGASLVMGRTPRGQELIDNAVNEGVLVLSPRSIQEVMKGQHVDERKRQIAIYSRALSVFPFQTESYLYHQEPEYLLKEKEVSRASSEFLYFRNNEKLSVQEIVLKARLKIEESKRRQRLQRNIIYRILRKLKHLITR